MLMMITGEVMMKNKKENSRNPSTNHERQMTKDLNSKFDSLQRIGPKSRANIN